MSNVSLVSMYDSVQTALARMGEGVDAVCAATANIARWLAEDTEEDRAAVERLREQLRDDRKASAGYVDSVPHKVQSLRHTSARLTGSRSEALTHSAQKLRATPGSLRGKSAGQLHITSVGLHLSNPESLTRSAEKLGYSVIEPAASTVDNPEILLQSASGERLAIAMNDKGKLALHTAGDHGSVQPLIRQHTLDRAVEHLSSKGMTIRKVELPSGDMQILARERIGGQRGGPAEIKTRIRDDGAMWVDIDRVKGKRCQEIVSELASAVGGEVSSMDKKAAYFQLPGEPTRTKVRI